MRGRLYRLFNATPELPYEYPMKMDGRAKRRHPDYARASTHEGDAVGHAGRVE